MSRKTITREEAILEVAGKSAAIADAIDHGADAATAEAVVSALEIARDEATGLALTGEQMDERAKADKTEIAAPKADKAKADEAKAKLRKNMAATSAVCPVCGAKARYACRDLHVTAAGSHFLYKCPKGCAFGSISKAGKMTEPKAMTVSYQTAKVPTVAPEGWLFVAAEPTVHIW